MENLPIDVVGNILFRLPVEVALQAKRVCTTWKALLRDYKSHKVGFLFAFYKNGIMKVRPQLFYGDEYDYYDHAEENYYYTDKTLSEIEHSRFIMRFSPYTYIMVGSCNGLVCFGDFKEYLPNDLPVLIICNPLTGESVYLPKPSTRLALSYKGLASGFGYCRSTNKYKVVIICHCKGERKRHVQVYTVGTGEWRYIESVGCCYTFDQPAGIYANGALYWLHRAYKVHESKIVAFDLEGEKFHSIPLPSSKDLKYVTPGSTLKLLGGNDNLYLANKDCKFATSDTRLYKRININTGTSYATESSSGWIKEFSIDPWKRNHLYLEPIAITRNNEVVLQWYNGLGYSDTRLYCYDPRTSNLNHTWDHYNPKKMEHIEAIPHTRSLVSLKDLGETDVSYLSDFGKNEVMGHKYRPDQETLKEVDCL